MQLGRTGAGSRCASCGVTRRRNAESGRRRVRRPRAVHCPKTRTRRPQPPPKRTTTSVTSPASDRSIYTRRMSPALFRDGTHAPRTRPRALIDGRVSTRLGCVAGVCVGAIVYACVCGGFRDCDLISGLWCGFCIGISEMLTSIFLYCVIKLLSFKYTFLF